MYSLTIFVASLAVLAVSAVPVEDAPKQDSSSAIGKSRSVANNWYTDLPHIDDFHITQRYNPGQSFYSRCNVCNCFADGRNAACTLKACPDYDDNVVVQPPSQAKKCEPGVTYYNQCQFCVCGDNGLSSSCQLIAGCNQNTLPGNNNGQISANNNGQNSVKDWYSDLPHIDDFDATQRCTPRQNFYNKCNVCYCGIDGRSAICSYKLCPLYDLVYKKSLIQ